MPRGIPNDPQPNAPMDVTQPPAAQEKPERAIPQLDPARHKSAEYERNIWVVHAQEGTTPEDLASLSYFAHVAAKHKPWDRIEVRAYDGSWYAELMVLEAGRNWSRQKLLRVELLTTPDVAASQAREIEGYKITYRGEFSKWSVIRKMDSALVHEGSGSEGAAIDWVNERLKAG